MAQLISLSRAARLVGVKRGTLQKQIQEGLLQTFEGELDLSELLKLYPQTDVDNSGMVERADRIIEQALGRMSSDHHSLPDAEILAARVTLLSHELGLARAMVKRYSKLINQLQDRVDNCTGAIGESPEARQLKEWLQEAIVEIDQPYGLPEEVLATDTFLRLMAAHVEMRPSGHDFFVSGTDTLLDAALRAGFAVRYGCTNGQCGRCKARVKTGNVKRMRSFKEILTDDEIAAGEVLMCTHTAMTDVLLEVKEMEHTDEIGAQQLPVSLRRVEDLSDTVRAIYLTPGDNKRLQFMSGQNIELVRDDRRMTLPVASCPCDETQVELHIVRDPDNPMAQYLFEQCDLGDAMTLQGPTGDCTLNVDSVHSLIFIAWGEAFAPLKSLIEQAVSLDTAEAIQVYWITPEDEKPYMHNLCRAWEDALDNLAYKRLTVGTEGLSAPDSAAGHDAINEVMASLSQRHSSNLRTYDFYLAAPASVARHIKRYLQARGVPDAQLRVAVV